MSLEIEFTDDEIREELARLGYENVPADKLAEFKKDLMKLIHTERSRNTSMNSSQEEIKDHDSSPLFSAGKHTSDPRTGNFTNHGSQWLENKGDFHEDWHYQGKTKARQQQARPKSTPSGVRVPGSYGLYELSSPSVEGLEDGDENNCRFTEDPPEPEEEKKVVRKTLRKTADGYRRVDESLSESDTSGIFEIYERIKNMAMRDCECGKTQPKSDNVEPPYRIRGINRQPSVIGTRKRHPHTRNLVRTKPGDRMKMYESGWKKQPPIGEDSRNNLRKMMHLKLLKKDDIQVDKKMYVPNTYVVPTTKQRLPLRWQVRSAMENYEMPPHGVYHDI